MPFSQTEARIRRLMMGIQEARRDVRAARDRVGRFAQGVGGIYQVNIDFGQDFTATVLGQVNGCNGFGFPGATITVKDHAGGATLATATCDSGGAFSATFPLSANPQSIDFVATPTGADAAKFTARTQNQSIADGTNTVGTITMSLASGYACFSQCSTYVPGVLPASFTFTYGGKSWTTLTDGTVVAGIITVLGMAEPNFGVGPPCVGPTSNDCPVHWSLSSTTIAGVSSWALSLTFGAICCTGTGTFVSDAFTWGTATLTATGAANCTGSPVSVTMPTAFDVSPVCSPSGTTPGGGGSISLVP
jgi:hypothetical protein